MTKITNKRFLQWMKIVHIVLASIWTGGVVCLFVLFAVTLNGSESEFTIIFPKLINAYPMIMLPVAVLILLQGVIYGFFTNFGFGKQRWLKLKWLFLLLVGLCTNRSMTYSRLALAETSPDSVAILIFMGLQITLLIAMIIISVFKFKSKKQITA